MSLRAMALRWLRVSEDAPPAPLGSHEVLCVERAAPGYLKYLLVRWLLQSAAELTGAVAFSMWIAQETDNVWVTLFEGVVLTLAVIRVFVRLLVIKLDYELRWYLITDRSLRIREGIWSVREITLTFANVQNVSVTQGPVQRLFGVSEVVVETAGGGGGQQQNGGESVLGHQGKLRGVANPHRLRDMILELLKKERGAGLGGGAARAKPKRVEPSSGGSGWSPRVLQALRETAAVARG